MSRRLDTVARFWTAGLLAIAAWSAYEFGWVGAQSGVLGQTRYAGQGLVSVVHINLVSVALGTGVVWFAVFLGLMCARRAHLVGDWLDGALLVGLLSSLSFFQLTMPHLRSNYYQSRYFLPLVVPFMTLFVLRRTAVWRASRFWLVTAPVLAFNLVFSGFLATTPEFGNTNHLIVQLERAVPRGAVVLGLGEEPRFDWLFANIVRYDLGGRYGSLGTEEVKGMQLLRQFRDEQDPPVLFVLSDRPLPLDSAVPVQRLEEVDIVYNYWSKILYPLSARRVLRTYFLYPLSVPAPA